MSTELGALEKELKDFIIATLALEDITAEEIQSDAPLFGTGLGLDSVDALELGVGLQKKFGVKLDPKDDSTRQHFRSVHALAQLVHERRAGVSG